MNSFLIISLFNFDLVICIYFCNYFSPSLVLDTGKVEFLVLYFKCWFSLVYNLIFLYVYCLIVILIFHIYINIYIYIKNRQSQALPHVQLIRVRVRVSIHISLGTKFQLKLTILTFWAKFTQKANFRSKAKKVDTAI